MKQQYPLKKIFNPLSKDFAIKYDINEDGNPPTFILHAGEIESFPEPVADHIVKHLAYEYVHVYGRKPNFDVAYEEAKKMIEDETIWIK